MLVSHLTYYILKFLHTRTICKTLNIRNITVTNIPVFYIFRFLQVSSDLALEMVSFILLHFHFIKKITKQQQQQHVLS